MNVFLLTNTYLTFADGTSTFYFFYQFILIYRVNIGKRAILNKNIGIIGHFLKDRDFIGNIGTLEGLNFFYLHVKVIIKSLDVMTYMLRGP